jgi:hypothetical protein
VVTYKMYYVGTTFTMKMNSNDEHSEPARAPHTNGPRDVPRCVTLSLLQETLRTRFIQNQMAQKPMMRAEVYARGAGVKT